MTVLRVGAKHGALRPVPGSPFDPALEHASLGPFTVAFSPDGRLLVTPGDNLEVFSVNQQTGALSHVSSAPARQDEDGLGQVAFSPRGNLVASTSDGVSTFAINRRTGAAHEVQGSPFILHLPGYDDIDQSPAWPAFSPDGNLLAAADNGDVVVFKVERSGALKQASHKHVEYSNDPVLGPMGVAGQPAFSPAGRLLVVPRFEQGGVAVMTVNERTGALANVRGSPFPTAPSPQFTAFSPSGSLLAIGNGDGTASLFSVNERTGYLHRLAGSVGAMSNYANGVAFSPRGGLLAMGYGANNEGVAVFSIPTACADPDDDDDCDPPS